MENIETCELCLKQIIKTEDFENFNCDEKQNLQILQNLKITVSRDAKICSDCVNISHLTYNFKMYCLTNNDHLKTLIRPSINDKLILEEVVVEKSKSEFKNEKVCRFCLNFFELNSLMEINLEQDVVLKDMLERCLPEIDTKFVQNPLICFICNKLLKRLYNFISQCKDTEIFRNLDPKTDVIVNENASTDKNINESFVKEENCDGIENLELQIKSEDFEIKEDIKDSIKESNSLLKEGEIQAEPSSFLSEYQNSLVRHKKIHEKACENEEEKVELYKCTICSFTTSNKCEIVKHKKKGHKDGKQGLGNPVEEEDMKPKPRGTIKQKQFICDICSYQTTKNEYLKQHYLIHEKPSEVSLFKCDYCPFATKWKRNLTSHTMRHMNPSELPKFKCNDCPYETSNKKKLLRHVFVHKNPSQVNMYKCKVCPYQTKERRYLQRHEKRHQTEIYTIYKCDECNYKVKSKQSFILHLRDHKESKQLVKKHASKLFEDFTVKLPHGTIKEKKFVCDICSYQTTRNDRLKEHHLIHKEPLEVNLFKCDYCPFASKWKRNLTLHTICHKNPSELPKFKCNDCPYETNKKKYLASHFLVHKNPSQVNMYKCKVCPFQTKCRRYLQQHQKRHQAEIYTCDKCNYKTKSNKSFNLHLRNHSEEKQPAKSN